MSLNIQKIQNIGLSGVKTICEGSNLTVESIASIPGYAFAWQSITGLPADVISLSAKSYTVCKEPYALLATNFVKTVINKFKK